MSDGERASLPSLGLGRGAGRGMARGAGLLSLGAPRGRGGQGGAGGGGAVPSSHPSVSASLKYDAAVRSTDNDAVGSRIAAMNTGYIEKDAYTTLLGPTMLPAPRSPIINIGTYLRCRAIDILVNDFLVQENSRKQIISLGAGSDSRFWRLSSNDATKQKLAHYVELDFPELTTTKVERILRHRELLDLVSAGDAEESGVRIAQDRSSLQGGSYSLISCDLRNVASSPPSSSPSFSSSSATVTEKIQAVLDPDMDTLILAECVLAYLTPASSTQLLQHLSSLFNRTFAVCYEMCIAGDIVDIPEAEPDKFGAVMLANLQARNLTLPGAKSFSTVHSHAVRFEKALSAGKGKAKSLKQVWQDLDEAQRARLSRMQGLDEVEELEMLLAHYAVSWYAHEATSPFVISSV